MLIRIKIIKIFKKLSFIVYKRKEKKPNFSQYKKLK